MDDGRMDIDSGAPTGRRKSITFNQLTRSDSGSLYPIERPGKLPGSTYRKVAPYPQQVYGEPITKDRREELWSNSSNLKEAKQEVKREGSPYVHLADEPSFIQAANNRIINQGINQEVQYFLVNKKYNWNTIAEIFLSRLGSVSGVGTSDDMKDYQVIYYQMLNLVRDPSGRLQQRLIQAIDILGGYNRVGRARRKTRGRKKLRKTRRKSKQ